MLVQVYSWLSESRDWMAARAQGHAQESKFWAATQLVLAQLSGLAAGYNAAAAASDRLTNEDIMLLNSDGDVESIEALLQLTTKIKRKRNLRCSALVKLTPGNKVRHLLSAILRMSRHCFLLCLIKNQKYRSLIHILIITLVVFNSRQPCWQELYFGHSTWDHYGMMAPRALKKYEYNFDQASSNAIPIVNVRACSLTRALLPY